MSLSRRQFLARTATVSAGAALAGLFATSGPAGAFPLAGYGPLQTDPLGLVDLPVGFSYKVLALTNPIGTTPATQLGLRLPAENLGAVPGAADGMGSVYEPATGRTYLVCNHELTTGARVPTIFRGNPVATYDSLAGAAGGCTTLVLDADMNVIDHIPAIAGTIRNCAGGMTPWGTWLTCEEDQSTPNGTAREKQHGYLFEVDPRTGLTNAVPYTAMGRANHEAVAIDPSTSAAYITEDATGSVVFKFVPNDTSQQFGSLGNGGSLYAMKVPGIANFAELVTTGQVISGVTWTPAAAADVAGLKDTFNSATVTRGTKIEGCWWIGGALWFAQSFSGAIAASAFGPAAPANDGGVFKYDPVAGTLTTITRIPAGGTTVTVADATTTQNHIILNPDNIAATPYGGAIWSQDGGSSQYLVALSPDGTFFPVARNPAGGEWAGAHFSHDGTWLFANQQTRGLTVAITGPWTPDVPPVVPEVPMNILLPLTGAATIAGVIAWRGRRMATAEVADGLTPA